MGRAAEQIVIVNEHDLVIGEENKEKCHDRPGILHRGFLAMVFDPSGRLLLTRRSNTKRLWPGFWDGTVASHLFKGEDYEQASQRRLREELGIITGDVQYAFKFEYQAEYGNEGTEHEICAVTMVLNYDVIKIVPDRTEISEVRVIDPDMLRKELNGDRMQYTPWLIRAFEMMDT